jgi:hypothetical protein
MSSSHDQSFRIYRPLTIRHRSAFLYELVWIVERMLCREEHYEAKNRMRGKKTASTSAKPDNRHRFAKLIEHQMVEMNMRNRDVIEGTGVSEDTFSKFLNGALLKIPGGDFQEKVADYLGLNYSENHAPIELGGYDRNGFGRLSGFYRTLRPSAFDTKQIISFRTEIVWHRDHEHATFKEHDRNGNKPHFGKVANYLDTSIYYLLSYSPRGHGYRQICLSRSETNGSLAGYISSTLQDEDRFRPYISPIVYLKNSDQYPFRSGIMEENDENYKTASDILTNFVESQRALSLPWPPNESGRSKLP